MLIEVEKDSWDCPMCDGESGYCMVDGVDIIHCQGVGCKGCPLVDEDVTVRLKGNNNG